MTFDPWILALHAASLMLTGVVLFASIQVLPILKHWDLASGSELQLRLERRTYLISTLLGCFFVFQLSSFFLYIYTAERLHTFFVGAMCAAGSLNVNAYGYPALILKLGNSLLAGIWLILNYADNRAYDYPLIRIKYAILLFLAPLIAMEAAVQTAYFIQLRPEIMTSCCGSLFSADSSVAGSGIRLPPSAVMIPVFYTTVALTVISGGRYLLWKKGGAVFSGIGALTFFIAIFSFLSFISAYAYELPTHHCPFCILKKEYGYAGYLLYAAVLGGGLTAAAVGFLAPLEKRPSLAAAVPGIRRKLAFTSLVCFLVFAAFAVYIMISSNLVLE